MVGKNLLRLLISVILYDQKQRTFVLSQFYYGSSCYGQCNNTSKENRKMVEKIPLTHTNTKTLQQPNDIKRLLFFSQTIQLPADKNRKESDILSEGNFFGNLNKIVHTLSKKANRLYFEKQIHKKDDDQREIPSLYCLNFFHLTYILLYKTLNFVLNILAILVDQQIFISLWYPSTDAI